jgi:hypothetical protein
MIATLTVVAWLGKPAPAADDQVNESEPNDSSLSADSIAAGQFGQGTVCFGACSASDGQDYWR